MVDLVKTISSEIDSIGRRLLKLLRYGKSDVQNVYVASPYGVDSNPIKGMIAVYAESSVKGEPVVIGYINKNQLAEIGEHRIFSTDDQGNIQGFIWLKNDGQIQLNGTGDNLVRYSPLNQELQSFKDSIQTELTKIQTGIVGAGGAYTPGILEVDISDSQIQELETT